MDRALRMTAAISALSALLVLAACPREPAAPAVAVRHHHHPPHGGTPIVLGDKAYHLELVLDPAQGRLQLYVLDGEMENFVRCLAPSVAIAAAIGGSEREVVLSAVANPETGESVGDTALFEGSAPWLKGARTFDGTVRAITIRGTAFSGVRFNFPKGNDTDE